MSTLYVSYQGGQGTPLVLFHGFGFTSQVWLPLVSDLITKYSVYLVDLPGFGNSDLMDWDTFKAKLFKQLPRNFAILGWSMGGGYGIQLASEHPEIISHLVCVGASPKFIKDGSWHGIPAIFFDEFSRKLAIFPVATLQEFVKLQSGKELTIELSKLAPKEAMQASLKLLKNWDLRNNLKKVNTACFMFGRLDKVVPAETLKIMQQLYPKFDYVLFKQAAHMPFISHKNIFLAELNRVV